jgi:fructosamine-3-kinase
LDKIDHSTLGTLIRNGIAPLADSLSLDEARISVTPILNWGGFVNRSFKVTDGRVAYHVKLATEPEALGGLERWRSLAKRLSRDYHAPGMRSWLDLPVAEVSGPIFEWIEGATPSSLDDSLMRAVCSVVSRLHEDADLAEELTRLGDSVATCAEVYASTYAERFTEDLAHIRTAPPPFLEVRELEWMIREAEILGEKVRASSAFQEPAEAPTHGDLWPNNVLVTPAAAWYLLDWDGLALGDPVMDWTMLMGPTRSRPEPVTDRQIDGVQLADDQRARVPLYARASLLDWIIDPLADWVEAQHDALHGGVIRESNRRVHERARAVYRELYE